VWYPIYFIFVSFLFKFICVSFIWGIIRGFGKGIVSFGGIFGEYLGSSYSDTCPGIVWDEIVGYLVTMFSLPHTLTWIVLGFALFRLLDILKPQPLRWIDRHIHGGWGIMLDDLLAGLAACAGVCVALMFTLAPSQIFTWVGVIFAAVMIGRLGSALTPLIGGLVIGIIESMTMALIAPTWAPLVAFMVLILILLLRRSDE
jgi:phosphatidylglycerophosphatase A